MLKVTSALMYNRWNCTALATDRCI